jgi:hypothetical protein
MQPYFDPTRKTTSKKMEDDLQKNKKMEDNLKKNKKWSTDSKRKRKNEKQPNFFLKNYNDDLKKREDDLKKNKKWKTT